MKKVQLIALGLVAVLASACTTEQLARHSYGFTNMAALGNCRNKIDPREEERCREQARKNYSDFKELQAEARNP